jgi:hypothetical protein
MNLGTELRSVMPIPFTEVVSKAFPKRNHRGSVVSPHLHVLIHQPWILVTQFQSKHPLEAVRRQTRPQRNRALEPLQL